MRYTILDDGDEILCNLNYATEVGQEAALRVIPTQAKQVVADLVSLQVKPNAMSQWLDRLTAAGASILLMHGEYYDDLSRLAQWASDGRDGFTPMGDRMTTVIDHAQDNQHVLPGRVVVMGSSRHGFATLHAMANNPDISAAVAHQPVVYWPRMSEFEGMDDNEIVKNHSLYQWPENSPPRPPLIQTGYADERVGQNKIWQLINPLKKAYADASVPTGSPMISWIFKDMIK